MYRNAAFTEGREEGEDRYACLTEALLNDGRIDDLRKICADRKMREKQYGEYNIFNESK